MWRASNSALKTNSAVGRLNGKPGAIIACLPVAWIKCGTGRRWRQESDGAGQDGLPHDVDYVVSLDTTRAVTQGMKEIVLTLVIAIVLVIIVVYIFCKAGALL